MIRRRLRYSKFLELLYTPRVLKAWNAEEVKSKVSSMIDDLLKTLKGEGKGGTDSIYNDYGMYGKMNNHNKISFFNSWCFLEESVKNKC